jgi:hypothetical protein
VIYYLGNKETRHLQKFLPPAMKPVIKVTYKYLGTGIISIDTVPAYSDVLVDPEIVNSDSFRQLNLHLRLKRLNGLTFRRDYWLWPFFYTTRIIPI